MYGSRYVYIYLYIFMVCKGVPAPPPFLRHPPLDPACPTLFKIFTLLPFKNRGGGLNYVILKWKHIIFCLLRTTHSQFIPPSCVLVVNNMKNVEWNKLQN